MSLRMQQIYGNRPNMGPIQPQQESNYPMYNEFLKSIAPMIHRRQAEEQARQGAELDRQRHIDNTTVHPAIAQRVMQQPEATPPPMNVRYDPSGGGGMTPYQMANLERQNRALDSQIGAREGNLGIADRRMDLAEAGGSRLEQIAAQAKNALEKQGVVGTQNMGRDAARENAANARQERAAQIATELNNLKNTQGIEAAKVKADLERELLDLRQQGQIDLKASPSSTEQKPLPPSQERTATLNRATQLANTRPDLAEYVTISGNGFVVKPSGDDKKDAEIRALIYGKGDINLPNTSTVTAKTSTITPKEDKLPAGAKPGGKWVTSKKYGKIYVE